MDDFEFPQSPQLSCLNCAYWQKGRGENGVCKFHTTFIEGLLDDGVLQFGWNSFKVKTPPGYFCDHYSVGSTNATFNFSRWYRNYIDELSALTGEVYALTTINKEKAERCKTLFYDQHIQPKDAAKLTRLAMAMLKK